MARPNADFILYAVHVAFWGAFAVTHRLRGPGADTSSAGPTTNTETATTARFSRTLVAVHMVAFAVMYAGIGNAVFPDRVPHWFPGQRLVGTLVIAGGAVLMCWSLVYFRSWRFRAKLDAGHELATGGPFALVRHPIYAGMNLLALGTAIWIPTVLTWVAVVLMILGSDLRGRAEEVVLGRAFGQAYRDYCARTRRFVPGLY